MYKNVYVYKMKNSNLKSRFEKNLLCNQLTDEIMQIFWTIFPNNLSNKKKN